MLKQFSALVVLGFFLLAPAYSSTVRSTPEEAFFENYYKQPDPTELLPWIRKLDRANRFPSDSGDKTEIVYFAAEVLKQKPRLAIDSCSDYSTLSPNALGVIAAAYVSSEIPGWRECVGDRLALDDRLKNFFLNKKPYSVLTAENPEVPHIRAMWGIFKATGSVSVLNRLLDVMESTQPFVTNKPPLEGKAAVHSAIWREMMIMMPRHPKLFDAVSARRNRSSGAFRDTLTGLLNYR